MHVETVERVRATLVPGNHPYMTGPFTPNHDEVNAADLEVIGTIPQRLDGVYLRNTQNPVHQPRGTYHPFDGDGMLHLLSFSRGRVEYRNRFIFVGDDNRIVIDCNGFRRDKDAELRQMALFMADKARSSGMPQEMGPLNPYERRIVHLAVAQQTDVTSESIGDAFMKTVIISTKD